MEKKLAEKYRASQGPSSHPVSPSQPSHQSTPNDSGDNQTPHSQITSPEPTPKPVDKKKPKSPEAGKPPEEVEELSDMMCSLVTNNCGETRYIGASSKNEELELG